LEEPIGCGRYGPTSHRRSCCLQFDLLVVDDDGRRRVIVWF
jgi:hypothetical protein